MKHSRLQCLFLRYETTNIFKRFVIKIVCWLCVVVHNCLPDDCFSPPPHRSAGTSPSRVVVVEAHCSLDFQTTRPALMVWLLLLLRGILVVLLCIPLLWESRLLAPSTNLLLGEKRGESLCVKDHPQVQPLRVVQLFFFVCFWQARRWRTIPMGKQVWWTEQLWIWRLG